MPILSEPPDDGRIFDRPGGKWTPGERLRVKIWLNTPPQIGRLLRFTSHHLGRGTTADDAEDAWGTFCVEELDATIDLYDARAPFEPFLLLRLRQFCWREGERIRKRGTESLERDTADGTTRELVLMDPNADPEQRLLDHLGLQRCLSAMPPNYLAVVVRHHLEGQTVNDIAEDLGLSRGNVRVRLCRGRQWLSQCLEPA